VERLPIYGSLRSTWLRFFVALRSLYVSYSRRGLPMAVFSMVSMVTTGLGSIISAWLELDPHLQWRWIQRIQAMCVYLF
jgi:hypothetical protein